MTLHGSEAGIVLDGEPLPLTVPARLYVCGITPYDVTHLGHAATFVWADTLARVVRMSGTPVVVTRNITDVDDVLTRTAAERRIDYDEFGLRQEFLFDQTMAALQIRPPDHAPRARNHVKHVIALTRTLLATGAAYERAGTVYFRGAGVPAAAGLDRDAALVLSSEYGDEPGDPARDDPFDVPLWKPSGEAHPAWPSPWGPGRPGWHAECAAMAVATLGGVVDVLAGGADLTFPHHAYQSAMVAAATGAGRFARRGFRVGVVGAEGAKMAKSTGNLVLVQDLLSETSGAALRLLLLDRPWSQPWEYRADDVAPAAGRLEDLYVAAGRKTGSDAAVDRVRAALRDDLDVTTALDVAVDAGGEAARLAIRTLALQ
ncbi:cysteine--tRNA ligase [Pseudonocardia sp. WMMC193]|uniref:cysteine--tRNA ligase n=1 Tax=Pseudonocardia sp. WMMC193 TaxID=2911965 RepID=UPI001F4771DB|nr:cysteine--tRNA ligase [Pseudonocardia sp. WMMC193]MCF7547498.1 cysteine--tRNA ligase [Pseudonocardia sp. WMMC193]